KREKTYHKGSVYDPIIDQFLESGQELVEISIEGKRPSYVVTQLDRRIKTRKLDIVASSSGGFTYLEKKTAEST
ncbi:MAG: hypothetical protein KAS54_07155, partial [Dehalococcoidia bacterium]|nr:hypothetical protein [Dehalococcoidia bacterium]